MSPFQKVFGGGVVLVVPRWSGDAVAVGVGRLSLSGRGLCSSLQAWGLGTSWMPER